MIVLTTFTAGENTYQAGRVPAMEQFHIVKRLAPVLGELASLAPAKPAADAVPAADDGKGLDYFKALTGAISRLSDEDSEKVIFGLLKYAKRQMAGGLGWAPVSTGQQLMFEDISMAEMLQVAMGVLKPNLASFMSALPSGLKDKLSAKFGS